MNWDGKDSNGNVVPSGLYIVTLEKSDPISENI
jgi:flagellar hook assembly protein FlgD